MCRSRSLMEGASSVRNRHTAGMRMTYDAEADAAFLYIVDPIGPGEAVESHMVDVALNGAAVIASFDSGRRLLGIEVLGASRALRAESLAQAERA